MKFRIIKRGGSPPSSGIDFAYLTIDNWNDYSFVTLFHLDCHDEGGNFHSIGAVKIGFVGQTPEISTHSSLEKEFSRLPNKYFSVGLDVDYYKKICSLSDEMKNGILSGLRDAAFDNDVFEKNKKEEVFKVSLLREVSISVIKGQFHRVINGMAPLTGYKFKFFRPDGLKLSSIELSFDVKVESTPSTNVHAIIGRNGAGKTTILNGMINAITDSEVSQEKFIDGDGDSMLYNEPISNEFFSGLVSVSFSAFDPFDPPEEQADPSLGACYFYIGLKGKDGRLKELCDLQGDFVSDLRSCFMQEPRKLRWITAIGSLGSDENFSRMKLERLANLSGEKLKKEAASIVRKMSSGHFVVLLTMTKLVRAVEEKTLVIIDEPESHLHPPLLSAFVRALSELLLDRNGVAIMATHSPVVLQEVPRSCVWIINRVGSKTKVFRPPNETFGENVGILTRDVFKLEVVKSGYHSILSKSVNLGGTYDEIVEAYGDQLGMEARAVLRTLVTERDNDRNRK